MVDDENDRSLHPREVFEDEGVHVPVRFRTSMTKQTASASFKATRAVSTKNLLNSSRALWMPGVSTKTIWNWGSVRMPRIRVLVVWVWGR